MIHFANDPSDYFSDSLRLSLDQSGILNLEDRTFAEKVRNKLRLRNHGCAAQNEALEAARGNHVQGVLWGCLDRFESSADGTVVKGDWQLVDLKTGQIVCSGKILEDTAAPVTKKIAGSVQRLTEEMQRGTSGISRSAGLIPWYIRFLGFVLLCLLLPVVTISFIRTMVAKRSNKTNAFMLGIYTVIDAIFAFFMIGGTFNSGWSVILFLIASGLALTYNYYLMCFALKLES